ncbi:unnamed protein product, partial [marine sediment metagenome]
MMNFRINHMGIENIAVNAQFEELRDKLICEIKNQESYLQNKFQSEKIRTQLSCINSIKKFVLRTKEITPEDYDVILNYLAIQVGSNLFRLEFILKIRLLIL